jgi:hypothetical protein
MYNKVLALLILFCSLALARNQSYSFATSDDFIPNYLQKKIDKNIRKIFKKQNFHIIYKSDSLVSNRRTEFFVKNDSDCLLTYGIVELCNSCKIGGCEIYSAFDPTAEYESFYYMIAFELDGTIKLVRVLEYNSEHGYEIAGKRWLKQFIGKQPGAFNVGQNVDAISGATISVNALVTSINNL